MHPLNFLDCNCGLGPWMGGPGRGYEGSPRTLLQTMDSMGIAEACAYALSEYECNPGAGNARLASELAANPRLHPVLVIGPHQCGEWPSPADLPARMKAAGAKMARLPLGTMAAMKELDILPLEPLFDALAARRAPLFIDCLVSLEQARTAELKTLLERWPAMPLILSFPKQSQLDRQLYYLWERFTHFYVELAGYQGLGCIEDVTRRFGARRLVYGSRYPHFTPLQGMLQVIYSGVEDAVKREIAGDTVRQLLREVEQ